MTLDLPRTVSCAGLLVVLAGFLFVFRPMEASIASRYAQLESARTLLERRLAIGRQIAPLEQRLRTTQAELDRWHLRDSPAGTVDRFLRALQHTAERNRLKIERVVLMAQPANELALEVTTQGTYPNVIQAVRDLNAGDFAARIEIAALLATERRPGIRPNLQATLSVALLRAATSIGTHGRGF